MTISILLSIFVGVVFGLLVLPDTIIVSIDHGITWGLNVMIFFVGIDIGKNKNAFHSIRSLGWKIILIPFSIAIGSVIGSIVVGFIANLSVGEAAAVGAGMGWYSLSAVLIDQLYSTELGAVSFLSNVFREVLAIVILPFIIKYTDNDIYAIAPSGATAMDTTLPVIARYTSPEITILAFISGVTLSMMVPFLVPFLLQFS